MDRTGPMNMTLWNHLADTLVEVWYKHEHKLNLARRFNEDVTEPLVVDFKNLCVCPFGKSDPNVEFLTRMRYLNSTKTDYGSATESQMRILSKPTAPNLVEDIWKGPSELCCIPDFKSVQRKLVAPFQGSFSGIVSEVTAVERSRNGVNQDNVFRTTAYAFLYIIVHPYT